MAHELTDERLAELDDSLRLGQRDLDDVVTRIEESLDSLPFDSSPHYLEVYGAATLVHGYYNKLEQLFERVARDLNSAPPEGPSWHKRLLDAVASDRPGLRPAVIRLETRDAIQELLAFRHLFRHIYVLSLKWTRVRELMSTVVELHPDIDADIEKFRSHLDEIRTELRHD